MGKKTASRQPKVMVNGTAEHVVRPVMASETSYGAGPARVSFKHVAEMVTDKVAELFHAHVLILDAGGTVIAGSQTKLVGLDYEAIEAKDDPVFQIPFCFHGQACEVVVYALESDDIISPRLAQVLVEMVINEATVGEHIPSQQELKNKFIYDLLHGEIKDEESVLQEAELLGLDLIPPRAVIVIDAADYVLPTFPFGKVDTQAQRRAQYIINCVINFFHLPNDLICAYIGQGQVAVLKASDSQNLADWADGETPGTGPASSWANIDALKRAADGLLARLPNSTGRPINIGLGRYHPGILGLERSYRDACVALSLGRRFHRSKRIHCLDELGIAAFVGIADEQTKIELASHLLSPLDDEPELIETLEVFFAEDCYMSVVASRLSIHRNTLSYRLDKVTSLTGLDPRCFDDAVQIRLALLLRSFSDEPLPSSLL